LTESALASAGRSAVADAANSIGRGPRSRPGRRLARSTWNWNRSTALPRPPDCVLLLTPRQPADWSYRPASASGSGRCATASGSSWCSGRRKNSELWRRTRFEALDSRPWYYQSRRLQRTFIVRPVHQGTATTSTAIRLRDLPPNNSAGNWLNAKSIIELRGARVHKATVASFFQRLAARSAGFATSNRERQRGAIHFTSPSHHWPPVGTGTDQLGTHS